MASSISSKTAIQRHETPSPRQSRPMLLFLSIFAFRLINAHFVQTSFQPDEYFQSLEPAWDIAFGPNSGAWLTWEWRSHLRTAVHPYLFASTYLFASRLCNLLSCTPHWRAWALSAAPSVLQAFFAAWMDLLTLHLANKAYLPGEKGVRRWTLLLTLCSPWQWFCSTRTFSNSLETALTVTSLYLFPWKYFISTNGETSGSKGLHPALTAAAAAFYLRPTNIIIWIAISAALVYTSRSPAKALTLVRAAALVGMLVILAFASVDRIYYNQWTFPPLKFLYINLVQSLAVFYGSNRVDYYLTEGLPLLLTTALPFALIGLWRALRPNSTQNEDRTSIWRPQMRWILAVAVLATILTLSTIAHKEMRFIYPLLPILHILAAAPISSFAAAPTQKASRRLLLFTLLLINIGISYYTTLIHQRGVIDVTHYLREVQLSRSASQAPVSIGFLMPCHSTPWRSHLQLPEITAWALTCEPPLNLTVKEREGYLDEADVFYQDPEAWVRRDLEGKGRPEFLVVFEDLLREGKMTGVLGESGYEECRRFFNTQWHDDGRRRGDVVVLCEQTEA